MELCPIHVSSLSNQYAIGPRGPRELYGCTADIQSSTLTTGVGTIGGDLERPRKPIELQREGVVCPLREGPHDRRVREARGAPR